MGKCCCIPLYIIAFILLIILIVYIVQSAKRNKFMEYERCGMHKHMVPPRVMINRC